MKAKCDLVELIRDLEIKVLQPGEVAEDSAQYREDAGVPKTVQTISMKQSDEQNYTRIFLVDRAQQFVRVYFGTRHPETLLILECTVEP